jgi:hypothetical protein
MAMINYNYGTTIFARTVANLILVEILGLEYTRILVAVCPLSEEDSRMRACRREKNVISIEVDLMTAAQVSIHFRSISMKFVAAALLVATASAFTATSFPSARSVSTVSPGVSFAPVARVSQT